MTTNEKLNKVLKSQDSATLLEMLNNGTKLNDIELIDVLIEYTYKNDENIESRFIKLLIENGIIVNISSSKTTTNDFMILAYLGVDEIIQDFISNGVDINATNKFGMNAFHFAVANGQYTTAKLLIENGADIFAKVEFEVEHSKYIGTKQKKNV